MDLLEWNYPNDAKTVIKLSEELPRHVNALNRILRYVQENKPEIIDKFKITLKKKLYSLILNPSINLEIIKIPKIQEEIQSYDELQKLYFTYCFTLWEIPENFSSNTLEKQWIKVDRAFNYPTYYWVLTLCEVLGRTEAIDFIKQYIDSRVYSLIKPNLEFKDLDYIWEESLNQNEKYPRADAGIGFRLSKGKVGFKVSKCCGADSMKPLNDPELSHLILCYGDTATFEARNPNFVYTMPKTLAKNDPYCDKCFHDKRHVSNIEHPDDKFWDNLEHKLKEKELENVEIISHKSV
ncbi:MAG: hypothetical protein ACXAC7_08400 [Candidatus Hodarchaeales archaeon]|jgi:hypothetical protein